MNLTKNEKIKLVVLVLSDLLNQNVLYVYIYINNMSDSKDIHTVYMYM